MRLTGGAARGIVLRVPPGDRVRPATDRTRQAVGNRLAHFWAGARVLDLFAGTGAYGLEALSRGAASAVFVEQAPVVLKLLEHNLRTVAQSARQEWPVRLVKADAQTWAPGAGETFDVVFIDPPYVLWAPPAGAALLRRVVPWVAPGGWLVAEVPGGWQWPSDLAPPQWGDPSATRRGDPALCGWQVPA